MEDIAIKKRWWLALWGAQAMAWKNSIYVYDKNTGLNFLGMLTACINEDSEWPKGTSVSRLQFLEELEHLLQYRENGAWWLFWKVKKRERSAKSVAKALFGKKPYEINHWWNDRQ